MSKKDPRPPVWVGHVVLESTQLEASAQFMVTVGMRPVQTGSDVAIFELRGGTHLVLVRKNEVIPGDAPFDLMVQDLRATHRRFTSLGLPPTPIEAKPSVAHEVFRVQESGGHLITFFSNHVSGPV